MKEVKDKNCFFLKIKPGEAYSLREGIEIYNDSKINVRLRILTPLTETTKTEEPKNEKPTK